MNKLSYDDYKVGWICALECELKAALLMLDQEYPPLTPSPGDNNTYTFGRIGMHNVVIVSLPSSITGTNAAARVATEMRRTFPLIFGLMVGIAGGIPSDKHDIRLGDVVVSEPSGRFGGVVEYDFGKTVSNGKFQRSLRHLNRPSDLLLSALPKAKAYTHGGGSEIMRYYQETLSRHPEAESFCTRPGHDVLFDSDYDDPEPNSSCAKCDKKFIIHRLPRASNFPVVHYGLIASGNQVMRHGQTRDQLREVANVLCYEMEAAGLMDTSPFLII